MIRLLTLFTLLFCFGCDDDCGHLNKVLGRILEEGKSEFGLIDGRASLTPVPIEKMDLCFEYQQKISREDASRLIIAFTEHLLNNAKNDPAIIEKFGCSPFTEQNLSFIIKFPCNGPDFNGISLSNGLIQSYARYPHKGYLECVTEVYSQVYMRVNGCELNR